MIEGNVLKFGYGDIAVYHEDNKLCFIQIEKAVLDNNRLVPKNEVSLTTNKVVLSVSRESGAYLYKQLKAVSGRKITKFEYAGYLFDFTDDSKGFAIWMIIPEFRRLMEQIMFYRVV